MLPAAWELALHLSSGFLESLQGGRKPLAHTDLIRAAGLHLLPRVQKIMIWVRSADRVYFLTERDHERGQG